MGSHSNWNLWRRDSEERGKPSELQKYANVIHWNVRLNNNLLINRHFTSSGNEKVAGSDEFNYF